MAVCEGGDSKIPALMGGGATESLYSVFLVLGGNLP